MGNPLLSFLLFSKWFLIWNKVYANPLQADAFRGQRFSFLGKPTLRDLQLLLFPQESPPFTPSHDEQNKEYVFNAL
ncbi:hypothetical protein [Texcoconibacillus texcoconensis]|uniref:Uncharacterized protein n=1 Tax=Texcoconibacillus texcoconensis TaxID=1095777 RepID=A0A840QQG8_9BACI|nr:hypothetical protein [Texcoconibacillus texcoconensis]MBB5173682.1 hypothetical protein [Texcoconibacillus texcoconensis]